MFIPAQRIFFVGIKGVAMANLARMMAQMGKQVSGSDIDSSFITDELISENAIKVIHSFEADDLPDEVDLIIYSASHGGKSNPQVVEAENRDIQVLHQSELLGQLIGIFDTSIAVAGCHGKTTTASLLAYALKKLTPEISYMVGTPSFSGQVGGDYAGTQYFVVEADEYGIDPPDNITPKFHLLNPDYAIITNVDHDHPDVYPTIEDTKKAFQKFINQILLKDLIMPQLILCGDDPNIQELKAVLPDNTNITYGYHADSDVKIVLKTVTEQGTSFQLSSAQFELNKTTFTVELYGEKNILNATAVITMLLHLGFSVEKVLKAIKGFTGAKRRFEYIGKTKKITLYDDYAHHPKEIVATIHAARARFPHKRLIILFQPHTYSRTKYLKTEFAEALSQADQAIVLPIFASAREAETDHAISSGVIAEIANKMHKDTVIAVKSKDEALLQIEKIMQHDDLIITMGAGDVYQLGKDILKIE